jgi:DNA-directed RNA polymerase sigma subunit (sigma70/sigma32)
MPKKIRSDMKADRIVKNKRNEIKGKEDRYVAEHHEGSFGVTKKEFMALLTKSAQPLKLDLKVKGTSDSHLSDGCSDKCKSQDKTVSKEDLPND